MLIPKLAKARNPQAQNRHFPKFVEGNREHTQRRPSSLSRASSRQLSGIFEFFKSSIQSGNNIEEPSQAESHQSENESPAEPMMQFRDAINVEHDLTSKENNSIVVSEKKSISSSSVHESRCSKITQKLSQRQGEPVNLAWDLKKLHTESGKGPETLAGRLKRKKVATLSNEIEHDL